ncbi:MCE family protein [Mycolicibacterium sp. 050232]|uniref:MCE family protein n=1 Tax=Mycolicibacterium sp. 050232 TaxID=3113982 RepID=UPI002E2AFB1E|nr:MCE family protein [Mycolicibacterium sp. 050232]MED5810828.1 MCE family protein [Mycolicibacterium sp. 050232]
MMVVLLAGCGTGLEDLPLPAPGQVRSAITVTAEFANAMNLPAKAKVKLNGADIGEVEQIVAQDFAARVTMRIDASVPLYTDATAELRSATPLGDIFVAVHQSVDRVEGARRLEDGDGIPLTATTSAATVEDVLSSAALLVNGGAVRQFVTVVNGAGDAIGGRGEKVAKLLSDSNTLISRLTSRSDQIDQALRNTSDLAATLASRRSTLDNALQSAAPAMDVIRENTTQLADLADRISRITAQLNRFPSMQGTDARSMIADLNTLAAEFNTMATDPWVNVNTWNRVIAMLNKIASGPNIHAVADVSQLALGALPDMNYPGDPMFHGADGTDWHAMIGSLRYSWNLLLSNTYGPQHAPR